ncbi:hypothetical protein [Natrinema altunense]|nr:hypothetical protein [Natrinema altunense]
MLRRGRDEHESIGEMPAVSRNVERYKTGPIVVASGSKRRETASPRS